MTYSNIIKIKAASLRKKGMSIPRIANELHIAKSTISLWVSTVPLPVAIRRQLEMNSLSGREKGRKMIEIERQRKQTKREKEAYKIVQTQISRSDNNYWKHIASLLFWCEGGKRSLSSIYFTNSDPALIRAFLYTLRKGFKLKEDKLRAIMHLHSYHSEAKQRSFWSKISKIPISQFSKTYLKPHTKQRKRENYQGCLSIRYHDADLARLLDALYHSFAKKIMGAC